MSKLVFLSVSSSNKIIEPQNGVCGSDLQPIDQKYGLQPRLAADILNWRGQQNLQAVAGPKHR